MELTARLTSLANATEGVNQQGNPWRKATATFETGGQYPKTVAIDFFNTNLEAAARIPLGTVCKVKFDIQSREYNGKWYTNLTGFGIEAAQQPPQQQPQPSWDAPVPPLDQQPGVEDDLPF